MSAHMSVHMSAHMPAHPSVRISVHMSVQITGAIGGAEMSSVCVGDRFNWELNDQMYHELFEDHNDAPPGSMSCL